MNLVINTIVANQQKEVLVAIYREDKIYNVKEILQNESFSSSVYLDSLENFEYPFLVVDDDILDVSQLYKILATKEFKADDELIDKIAATLTAFSREDIVNMQEAFKVFNSYMTGEIVKIKLSPSCFLNLAKTVRLVEEINSSGNSEELFLDNNKTVKRYSEDDEFYIRVPSYTELQMGMSLLPPIGELYEPYGDNRGLGTPDYRQYLGEAPIEYVLGNSENNNLEIQPNEQRYKNALKHLMCQGIKEEFPDVDPEEALKSNVGSKLVMSYIINVALLGLWQNWSHTGSVPMGLDKELTEIDPTDLDDESEGSDDSDVGGKRSFFVAGGVSNRIDSASILSDLLSEKSFSSSVEDLIDFAIKINRFGKYKPTRIKLREGEYLDMNSFSIVGGSGSYSESEEIRDSEGNNLIVDSIVEMSDLMVDKKFMQSNSISYDEASISMPVGFRCIKSYISGESVYVFLSFIDLIKAYQSNDARCKIEGISFDGSKISVRDDINSLPKVSLRDTVNLVSNSSCYYYCYPQFVDAFFVRDCFSSKVSTLSLFNKFFSSSELNSLSCWSYENLEDLDDLVKMNLVSHEYVIERNIARFIIPLLCQANKFYTSEIMDNREPNVSDVIGMFLGSIESLGFTGVFGDGTKLAPVLESNFFNSNSNNEEDEEDMSKLLLTKDISNLSVARVYVTKSAFDQIKETFTEVANIEEFSTPLIKGGEPVECVTVGYVGFTIDPNTKKPSTEKVFVNPSLNVNTINSRLPANKLTKALTNNVMCLVRNKKTLFTYSDEESCEYYCRLISAIITLKI